MQYIYKHNPIQRWAQTWYFCSRKTQTFTLSFLSHAIPSYPEHSAKLCDAMQCHVTNPEPQLLPAKPSFRNHYLQPVP
ncbi:hypothetical protein EYC80_001400 [Monilinia laxa]|uniref:Uncharacterized protein n=1 Tax=Monilinia laxa TaxID=61186 RepID=A0A5N6K983_MONLA|nr:hypothetical protein EYC80_001400 [Monilinia laxa]